VACERSRGKVDESLLAGCSCLAGECRSTAERLLGLHWHLLLTGKGLLALGSDWLVAGEGWNALNSGWLAELCCLCAKLCAKDDVLVCLSGGLGSHPVDCGQKTLLRERSVSSKS